MKKITCGDFRRTISILTILVIALSLIPVFQVKAQPTGTLTGTIITINIGQILAINTITVTDAGVPEITAANDICIRIQAGTNANWDVADTTATFGGTAAARAGVISYPAPKTLKIDVLTNFLANETLTISALSFVGHTAATAGAVLQWQINDTNCAFAAGVGNGAANTAITVADGVEDTLTAVTAVPGSNFTNIYTTNNYTVNFTVPATGVITRNGNIKVTFPAGFNVAGAVAGALTNIDGTVVLAVAAQVVTLARQNDGTNSLAGAKAVVINNIVNTTVPGSYTVIVRTDTSGNELLATANSAAFLLTAADGGGGGYQSDFIAPTSVITDPTDGQTIPAGQPYTIKGTAKDDGGSLVQKIEVSLDSGKTWQKTQIKDILANVFSWEYVWQNPIEGSYTIKSWATDEVGNIEVPGLGIKVTVAAVVPPSPTPPETPPEKPIAEMTAQELEAKILEIQQKIIDLLSQLIQILQQQIQELLAQRAS